MENETSVQSGATMVSKSGKFTHRGHCCLLGEGGSEQLGGERKENGGRREQRRAQRLRVFFETSGGRALLPSPPVKAKFVFI